MPKRRNYEDHPYREAPHVRRGESQPVSTQQILPTWDRDYTVAQVHNINDQLNRLVLQRDDWFQTLDPPVQEEMDWHMNKQSTAGLTGRTKRDNDLIKKLRQEKRSVLEKYKTASKNLEKFKEENETLKKDCHTWHTQFLHEKQTRLINGSTFNNMLKEATEKKTTTDVYLVS